MPIARTCSCGFDEPRSRPRGNGAVAGVLGALLLSGLPGPLPAQPVIRIPDTAAERRVPREQITLETVRIEGQLQSWVMRKICLDGQAYWIGFSETAPTAMAASFKDGKPEQCSVRAR